MSTEKQQPVGCW